MDFFDLIKIRQSTRSYENKPVEKEKILQCIEAARLSPSANNSQPWKFIVIDEAELREKVASNVSWMGMNKFAPQAPVMVAIVLEKGKFISSFASVLQKKEYSLIDIGIVANQFCLQAADLGLATCMVGWFNERKIKKLLGIPKKKRIPLIITLGYSEAPTRDKIRKPVEEMHTWNSY